MGEVALGGVGSQPRLRRPVALDSVVDATAPAELQPGRCAVGHAADAEPSGEQRTDPGPTPFETVVERVEAEAVSGGLDLVAYTRYEGSDNVVCGVNPELGFGVQHRTEGL